MATQAILHPILTGIRLFSIAFLNSVRRHVCLWMVRSYHTVAVSGDPLYNQTLTIDLLIPHFNSGHPQRAIQKPSVLNLIGENSFQSKSIGGKIGDFVNIVYDAQSLMMMDWFDPVLTSA